MWREWSIHQRKDSEFLDVAMARIVADDDLTKRAEQVLIDFRDQVAKAVFLCPQSADLHAEGPEVRDHLCLMFKIIFAVLNEKIHVGDIEELRRLKGFVGEFDEIEEIIKEKVGSLEVFVLSHDLGKSEVVAFSSRDGSVGCNLGFQDSLTRAWQLGDREKSIKKYQKVYQDFVQKRRNLSAQEIYPLFFIENQISLNYHGYAKQIAHPDQRKLLEKISEKYRLTPEDTEDVFHIILLHEDVLENFSRGPNVAVYNFLVNYCVKHGRDADDFLDLVLAVLFLEVCATPRFGAKGIYFDLSPVINFLITEREFAPWKNEERLKRRKDKKLKIERALLRQAGLDGDSLMKLLGMKPSPEFGSLLAEIHLFARGGGFLPVLPEKAAGEIFARVKKFKNL